MPWSKSVEEMSARLVELIRSVEGYRLEIEALHTRALLAKRSEPTLKVWSWHMELVESFRRLVQDELQDVLIRLAEHDYELRRPNTEDIFI